MSRVFETSQLDGGELWLGGSGYMDCIYGSRAIETTGSRGVRRREEGNVQRTVHTLGRDDGWS